MLDNLFRSSQLDFQRVQIRMLAIPLFRRGNLSGQPTAPSRSSRYLRNSLTQNDRFTRYRKTNREILLHIRRSIRYRYIHFQFRILICIIQIRYDTQIGQVNLRNGEKRHFTRNPPQLMRRILRQATQHISQRLTTNPQSQYVLAAPQPIRHIQLESCHTSHMGTYLLSIQINDRLAGNTIEAQLHPFPAPIRRQGKRSLVPPKSRGINLKALHRPLSRYHDWLPLLPHLFPLIKISSGLLIKRPNPIQ